MHAQPQIEITWLVDRLLMIFSAAARGRIIRCR